MKDEKEPLEQKQNSEEEEYSFLQEIPVIKTNPKAIIYFICFFILRNF